VTSCTDYYEDNIFESNLWISIATIRFFLKMGLDETAGPCLAITLTITTTTVPSPRDEVLEDTSRTKISVLGLGLKIPRSCT